MMRIEMLFLRYEICRLWNKYHNQLWLRFPISGWNYNYNTNVSLHTGQTTHTNIWFSHIGWHRASWFLSMPAFSAGSIVSEGLRGVYRIRLTCRLSLTGLIPFVPDNEQIWAWNNSQKSRCNFWTRHLKKMCICFAPLLLFRTLTIQCADIVYSPRCDCKHVVISEITKHYYSKCCSYAPLLVYVLA